MNEPWFNANLYSWIPGALLGVMCGIYGALAGILAPKVKAKKQVFCIHFILIGVSLILLLFGIIAYFSEQPYGIWYGFGFAGLLCLIIISSLTPILIKRYREAELRKSVAQDII
ncbi:MAG TPA: hypothetical protein PKY81_01870 [bacterium]|nr:hypothetical protein [bacterium]HPN29682.1 hypothetical protein [bacterium]